VKRETKCNLVQLVSHAIAGETTEAGVKDCSKVHKRMTRQKKEPKLQRPQGNFGGAKIR